MQRPGPRRFYTPEEDALILALPPGSGLAALARRLDRTPKAIKSRRKSLKNRPKIRPPIVEAVEWEEVRAHTPRPPFARPAWFNEDLSRIARVAAR